MHYATGTPVELSEVVTWPQALVGALLVIVILGLPQVFTYLNSRAAKKQVTNNGGGSMKDAVDRIERKQDAFNETFSKHVDDAANRDQRIVRLETIIEMTRLGGTNGDNPGPGSV